MKSTRWAPSNKIRVLWKGRSLETDRSPGRRPQEQRHSCLLENTSYSHQTTGARVRPGADGPSWPQKELTAHTGTSGRQNHGAGKL